MPLRSAIVSESPLETFSSQDELARFVADLNRKRRRSEAAYSKSVSTMPSAPASAEASESDSAGAADEGQDHDHESLAESGSMDSQCQAIRYVA